MASAADPATRTVRVKLAVPGRVTVRSGEYVRVQVPAESAAMLLVPATAVSAWGDLERVFVVGPDGRAVLRLVQPGSVRGGDRELLSGVAAGEQVVVTPPAGLAEGDPLDVRR
jgi:membrane fusion protein (multidrug efflux system)